MVKAAPPYLDSPPPLFQLRKIVITTEIVKGNTWRPELSYKAEGKSHNHQEIPQTRGSLISAACQTSRAMKNFLIAGDTPVNWPLPQTAESHPYAYPKKGSVLLGLFLSHAFTQFHQVLFAKRAARRYLKTQIQAPSAIFPPEGD